MEIIKYNDTFEEVWQNIAENSGTLYHDIRWRKIIADSYGHLPKYYLFKKNKKVVGILPLFQVNKTKNISLPYLPYAGPIFTTDFNNDDLKMLINKIEGIYSCQLRYLSKLSSKQGHSGYVTMIRELKPSIEEEFKSLHYKQRNMIRKSGKSDFSITPSNIDEYYSIYLKCTNSLGTPGHKKAFFENILISFKESVRLNNLFYNKTPIGTIFEIDYGNTRYDLWAFSFKEYFKYSPNIYMYWETLKNSIDNNIQYYDFGRSILGNGTYNFKKKWNALPYSLEYIKIDKNCSSVETLHPLENKIIPQLWSRTPYLFTNYLGPALRKYIY